MRQRKLMNQINVVPYIDVMLVLLVIFMVTAPMIQTGIVDLPSVGEVPQPPSEAMYVHVLADGSYAMQDTGAAPIRDMGSAFELMQAIEGVRAENPGQSIVVAADKSVAYEKVMDTLDALRKAGFSRVGLQTQTGSGG